MCSLFVCLDVNHAGSLLLASSNQHRAGVQVFPPLMKSLVKSAAELCVCVGGGSYGSWFCLSDSFRVSFTQQT